MTQRGASIAALAAIAASKNTPVHLWEGYFDSGTIYLNDSPRDILWNGNTYIGAGQLIGFDQTEDAIDLAVISMTFALTGVPNELIAIANAEQFVDRKCNLYVAMLDDSGVVIVDPILMWAGKMDECDFSEDPTNGTASIAIKATSNLADWQYPSGRFTNPASQQQFYPGDNSMQFVASLEQKVLNWTRR